jgi:hypothetical protein
MLLFKIQSSLLSSRSSSLSSYDASKTTRFQDKQPANILIESSNPPATSQQGVADIKSKSLMSTIFNFENQPVPPFTFVAANTSYDQQTPNDIFRRRTSHATLHSSISCISAQGGTQLHMPAPLPTSRWPGDALLLAAATSPADPSATDVLRIASCPPLVGSSGCGRSGTRCDSSAARTAPAASAEENDDPFARDWAFW